MKMGVTVSPKEEAEFKRLNRLRMKVYRDRKRKNKYTPRLKEGEPKNE